MNNQDFSPSNNKHKRRRNFCFYNFYKRRHVNSDKTIMTAEGISPKSPTSLVESVIQNRLLIFHMARRDISSRYKGSVLGSAWSFFTPILMLSVYTFVFSEVFKSKWGHSGGENKLQFALILFTGLIMMNFFNEVLNRASGLIVTNVNYVKKVIFPLEIFPVVTVISALFNAFMSIIVLLVAFFLINLHIYWTTILIIPILLPLAILAVGISWFLSALGVFLRDISQTILIITMMLMFLSPIFYPLSAVPEQFRRYIMANPLAFIIGQARDVIIWGKMPDWIGLSVYMICASVTAYAGYAWFQYMRKGFADVL